MAAAAADSQVCELLWLTCSVTAFSYSSWVICNRERWRSESLAVGSGGAVSRMTAHSLWRRPAAIGGKNFSDRASSQEELQIIARHVTAKSSLKPGHMQGALEPRGGRCARLVRM